ncbi:unnamed protein product [Anisakis simplex]|uniref:Uncharacterized protein n=1 Tax=Anisakis simplex TaxID=6269 RepID=A0A0M3K3J1_ANISI|nr:unnamed protein product [Anisakis simplex]
MLPGAAACKRMQQQQQQQHQAFSREAYEDRMSNKHHWDIAGATGGATSWLYDRVSSYRGERSRRQVARIRAGPGRAGQGRAVAIEQPASQPSLWK